jgi:hypothetical protein
MNTYKKVEFALMYLVVFAMMLGGCVGEQYAPINYGDLFVLHSGLTNWLCTSGDNLTKWYSNFETGMDVFARPYLDGWIFAVRKGDTAYGHMVNNATWASFRDWLVGAGGFSQMLRQLPSVVNMPIVVMPVMVPADGQVEHIWELFPWMGGGPGYD